MLSWTYCTHYLAWFGPLSPWPSHLHILSLYFSFLKTILPGQANSPSCGTGDIWACVWQSYHGWKHKLCLILYRRLLFHPQNCFQCGVNLWYVPPTTCWLYIFLLRILIWDATPSSVYHEVIPQSTLSVTHGFGFTSAFISKLLWSLNHRVTDETCWLPPRSTVIAWLILVVQHTSV